MRFLFPTIIHDMVVSNFDQDLCIHLSRELKKKDPKGVEKSNVHGWQIDLFDFKQDDYLLLTGDPAIIGVACSIVSDMTNGKYNLLKWDKQERQYYPIEINLYEKGEIDE